jgi:hypothetical protein
MRALRPSAPITMLAAVMTPPVTAHTERPAGSLRQGILFCGDQCSAGFTVRISRLNRPVLAAHGTLPYQLLHRGNGQHERAPALIDRRAGAILTL